VKFTPDSKEQLLAVNYGKAFGEKLLSQQAEK